ncbi:hypothetical protein [Bacillus toyonensis]|uniref:hypothetical protein n=1 Tax=Bacillus toyonensis TaxID=155322 RepID=UPI00027A1919|nr:hypothetical protein [Bacillus toyonensis]EJR66481.1 hypothetical protein IIO_01097 [Bacillus cereus VD115]PDY91451.1 hypothetical protein CON67_10280 [Bacillus toyonensis]
MKYGVYLDGEVMTTNEDYFEALKEAEYLTKDTGVVHWVMPIKEEAKWDEQRVKAYIGYVENSEKKIMKLESDYINAQKELRGILERIESEKRSKENSQKELYVHGGWMLYDGEWVEVDKQ